MADVLVALGRAEWLDVVVDGDPLDELPELGSIEGVEQLGLADQDHLQQLVLVGVRAFDAWVTRPLDLEESFEDCVAEGFLKVGVASIEATMPALIFFHYLGQESVRRLAARGRASAS